MHCRLVSLTVVKQPKGLSSSLIVLLLLSIVLGVSPTALGAPAPKLTFKVIHEYPHDPAAFTQGLIYLDGALYESTGIEGRSSLRKVQLETGKVLQESDLSHQYFAEGLTNWSATLVQLTWLAHVGFVYQRSTFKRERQFTYDGEGWGLTQDGKHLIMSDGSDVLRYLDPNTFRVVRTLKITDAGEPVRNLNELEFIRGTIYANVWQTDQIAEISPSTGKVTAWIDLEGLLKPSDRPPSGDAVLNGIAYDAKGDRLFVTGKLWPKLFQIKLVPKPD
jgi:glutamine cyclotransferase